MGNVVAFEKCCEDSTGADGVWFEGDEYEDGRGQRVCIADEVGVEV